MKLKVALLLCLTCISGMVSAQMLQKLGWVRSDQELAQYHYANNLEQLYGKLNHRLIWLDPKVTAALEQRLKVIDVAGISPEFSRLYQEMQYAKDNHKYYQFELLATDALLRYLSYADLSRSRAEPWFHGEQVSRSLPEVSANRMAQVIAAARQDRMMQLIEQAHPISSIYNQTLPVIDELLSLSAQQNNQGQFAQSLRNSSRIADPQMLYFLLDANGIDMPTELASQSTYNREWQAAVKQFQQLRGLEADGVVGKNTRYWLNYSAAEQARVLALNVERARGYATQKSAYIQVNLPQYSIRFWANNQLQFDSRVIVGRVDRPTPLMWTSLSTIVVNPTWNVPIKIMRKDLIPKQVRDHQYLVERNFSIIPYWGSSETIDVQAINWSSVNPKTFNYRLTQSSGPHNALGRYKFQLPNKRAIYMHDTPGKSLFGKDQRAFSSGCVRIEHADKFALQLMEVQGQALYPLYSSQSNHLVRMRKGIPVEFIYRSAWVEDGQLHMRKDIYGYDRKAPAIELAKR